MRRRKKPVVNESESTGKIGHEIPQGQPAPIQPSYLRSFEDQDALKTPARESDAAEPVPTTSSDSAVDRDADAPKPAGQRADRQRGRRDSHASARRNAGPRSERRPDTSGRTASQSHADGDESQDVEADPGLDSQPASEPEAKPGAAQAPKGYVVLAIGLPGSGKSTWFRRRGVTPLSSDMLRGLLFDNVAEQRFQGLVFSTLRSLLRARLIAKMTWNYVDATNLSPHERRQWIKMARSFGYEVHAVFFDVPFEICMERNRRRDRTLTEEAMAKMQERLRPPSFKEGFHKITVVRVKSASSGAAQESPSQA